MELKSKPIGQLLEMYEEAILSGSDTTSISAEITLRAETHFVAPPDVTSPQQIVARAVDELRRAGWYVLAHACEVIVFGADPDSVLLTLPDGRGVDGHRQEDPDRSTEAEQQAASGPGGLPEWIVECARLRAGRLRLSCRMACVGAGMGGNNM